MLRCQNKLALRFSRSFSRSRSLRLMAARAGLDHTTVVQAAATLADQQGLEAISLATLAAQLGVRTPTLYHYVDGLPGLRRELALLGDRELAARLGRAVMGKAGADALGIVLQALAAYQLPEDAAIHVVRGLRSLVHGFATLEVAGGFGLPLDV